MCFINTNLALKGLHLKTLKGAGLATPQILT